MRALVYTDYAYHRRDGAVFAERAFGLFVSRVGELSGGELILVGRPAADGSAARYRLPPGTRLEELPSYASLAELRRSVPAIARAARRFWRSLEGADVVWILGPHPAGVLLALIARLRRVPVVLGVRQDLPAYVRHRHPDRRDLALAADLLERVWRRLARTRAVVAVGPEIASHYAASPRVCEVVISLVEARRVHRSVPDRDYAGPIRLLSVGRIEAEKNPLMLLDILGHLSAEGVPAELIVAGEGPLSGPIAAEARRRGLAGRVTLAGYVAQGEELDSLYREAHFLVHSSWTEGFPQVMVEAAAAGLPIVASDVGGIAAGMGAAVVTVPPGDARAAAAQIRRLLDAAEAREAVASAALEWARAHTLDREAERVCAMLEQGARRVLTYPQCMA